MVVFSLRGWSLYIPTEFHVFDGTLLSLLDLSFVYRTFTFYGLASQLVPLDITCSMLIWAFSLSLAATKEIEFSFSSSGYLDVSVLRVSLLYSYVFTV